MILSFFGLTFHAYGLILAAAMLVGILLAEHKANQVGVSEQDFWSSLWWVLIGGIIGARVWHVVTDLQFYLHDSFGIFAIWRGGLSILGAIVGGAVAIVIPHKVAGSLVNQRSRISSGMTLKMSLDLSVFGLPFAQAIGRLGNFVNQELYGLPTNLPWGIYIEPAHRTSEFNIYNYYHPLFAYEGLLMLVFGILVWKLRDLETKKLKSGLSSLVSQFFSLGSGAYFLMYLIYYSIVRFLLDFLRVYHQPFLNTGLTRNQVIILACWTMGSIWYLAKTRNHK